MAANIKDIIDNVKTIYLTDSNLSTLLDFERTIDELDLYTFKNWKNGELVEGPIFEKYFITCTFMWPHKKMPDPRGGERLLQYGCDVTYEKSHLKFPLHVKTPNDFIPGTKVPKLKKSPIWLVTIVMPKSLINDIQKGSLEVENEQLEAEDIEFAYDEGENESTNNAGASDSESNEELNPGNENVGY